MLHVVPAKAPQSMREAKSNAPHSVSSTHRSQAATLLGLEPSSPSLPSSPSSPSPAALGGSQSGSTQRCDRHRSPSRHDPSTQAQPSAPARQSSSSQPTPAIAPNPRPAMTTGNTDDRKRTIADRTPRRICISMTGRECPTSLPSSSVSRGRGRPKGTADRFGQLTSTQRDHARSVALRTAAKRRLARVAVPKPVLAGDAALRGCRRTPFPSRPLGHACRW